MKLQPINVLSKTTVNTSWADILEAMIRFDLSLDIKVYFVKTKASKVRWSNKI